MANRYTARLRLREANRCCGTVYRIHGGAVEVPGLGTPGQHRAESEGRRGGRPQEVEETIGGLEAEWLRCGVGDAAESSFLHGEVGFDVLVGGGRVLVAEPEGDDGDVDSGLEQMHRGRVAQRVGRDPSFRERGVAVRCLSAGDAQLITDKGRLSWTALERRFALHPTVPSKLIMSSMQDRYQQEVGKRFGLERGEIGSRRKHEAINRRKGFFERVIEAPSTWSDRRRAEASLLHAKDAEHERDRAVQGERAAKAETDRALDAAASAEAERTRAIAEQDQAVARTTVAEAECDDLKRSLSALLRERDEAGKDRAEIHEALRRERAERTAETPNWNETLANAAIRLIGARAGHAQALRKIKDLRKAAPPTQVHIDRALEHARAADEARVGAEAERDQATAGRDRARQAYLAEKQQREHVAAKLVQDVAEARQQGYQRGQASRASEIDAAGDRARDLQIELDALRKRRSAAVQVARRGGLAAGRAERDDRVTALQQTVERLTTQLTAVNQDRERLDGKVKNLTEHCDDLKQRLKEPQA